jgi:hypothetical protein
MIRVYICPVIGAGTKLDPYRSKAQDFGYQHASFMRSNPDGSSAIAWALTVVASQDFTAIDADATCDDVFAGDLPATINTRPELLAFLRGRTVGDIPTARRASVLAVLDKYQVVRTDLGLTTPLWRLMQRIVSTSYGTTANEADSNFAAAFL